MSEILFSNESMQCIKMVSNITKAAIIDCFITDEKFIFVVEKGQIGIALGPKARNLEKLRTRFKKPIKFVEFDEDKEKFLINLFKPYKIKTIDLAENGDSVVAKVSVELSDKSKIIGKGGKNIEIIRTLAKRHHSIKDVQIK